MHRCVYHVAGLVIADDSHVQKLQPRQGDSFVL
jgi:hypothetical protein